VADVFNALAELERRYDGPIPETLRRHVHSSAERRLRIEAQGQADLFAALVWNQVEAIRLARRTGAIPDYLLADLKLYRQHEFWWRRETQRLAATVTPSGDDAP
jgi:hypothetical protein